MGLVLESHRRSQRFHAEIARRASLVPQREDRTYSIPNTPYGIPKLLPVRRRPTILAADFYYPSMWFYHLVFAPTERTERRLSIVLIQQAAANHFGITLAELLSQRRDHKVVIPRQVAIYLAKKMTTKSLPEVGRRFGGRDHTTILHAVRKIEARIQVDEMLAANVQAIRLKVTA